jgi:hypothetical protein
LPQKGSHNIYYDRELLVLARAVYLAMQWRKTDSAYTDLQKKFQAELSAKLKGRFDRFAVLKEWNFADSTKCIFDEQPHGALGDKIPDAIDEHVRHSIFEPEDFEELVEQIAASNGSLGTLLRELREPRTGGKSCIPWLGETAAKERVLQMCARGQIAINVRQLEMLQLGIGETADEAWHRMKGKVGSGKHLDETTLHKPEAVVSSSGKTATGEPPQPADNSAGVGATVAASGGSVAPSQEAGNTGSIFRPAASRERTPHSAPPTSNLNLLGQIEQWGIRPATPITNVTLTVAQLTGSQLEQLLKRLPDGVTYGLELEKESDS